MLQENICFRLDTTMCKILEVLETQRDETGDLGFCVACRAGL